MPGKNKNILWGEQSHTNLYLKIEINQGRHISLLNTYNLSSLGSAQVLKKGISKPISF